MSVSPSAICSYPNLKSVKELIYKRGYGKLNKQRIPLTDNAVIEEVSYSSQLECIQFLPFQVLRLRCARMVYCPGLGFCYAVKLTSTAIGGAICHESE
jgi:hypothetical protein